MQVEEQSLLDKYRHINVEHDWWDSVYDLWVEKLEQVGYDDIEINFSGFWSQGDGASFTGRVYEGDVQKFMDAHNLATKYPHIYNLAGNNYIRLRLSRISHHYYHSNTVEADGEMEEVYEPDDDSDLREAALYAVYQEADKEWVHFINDFSVISAAYMDKIYTDLEVDYDYLTSDDAVREALSANDIH